MNVKSHRRKRFWHEHRRTPPGTSPGTISVDPQAPPPVIRVLAYDAGRVLERTLKNVEELVPLVPDWPVLWVDVTGLGDAATIARLGEIFHLHPLALEDVVNVHQRAKVEDYQDYLFLVARSVELTDRLETEQLSIFLGKTFVLTFQERPGDCFDPLRQRIRTNLGVVRSRGTDYLVYALLDAVVDAYYPVLEEYSDRIEALDEVVSDHRTAETVRRIHNLRIDLLALRRAIWPHRELLNALVRDPYPLVNRMTHFYLRDCFDHVVQIIDLVETYREMCSDLTDYALMTASNRLNEVMKVLTIIATLFIPLSFIASWYGMNFKMPELEWRWGYPYVATLMGAVALGLLGYFWRRGWIGPAADTAAPRPDAPVSDAGEAEPHERT